MYFFIFFLFTKKNNNNIYSNIVLLFRLFITVMDRNNNAWMGCFLCQWIAYQRFVATLTFISKSSGEWIIEMLLFGINSSV